MTGQNDRQDRSLTGQVRDQAGHCPLTGRYLQPWEVFGNRRKVLAYVCKAVAAIFDFIEAKKKDLVFLSNPAKLAYNIQVKSIPSTTTTFKVRQTTREWAILSWQTKREFSLGQTEQKNI